MRTHIHGARLIDPASGQDRSCELFIEAGKLTAFDQQPSGFVADNRIDASGLIAARTAVSPEELAIAERVYVGQIGCELGVTVSVIADPVAPGHFHVGGKGFKYHMAPVVTSTGTVRLEDPVGGAVWLQIANKSMLMDQKRGQRLADECMSPEQTVVAEAIKKTPPPSLLDAKTTK